MWCPPLQEWGTVAPKIPPSEAKNRLALVTAAKAVALALTPGLDPIDHVTMWSKRRGQVRATGRLAARPCTRAQMALPVCLCASISQRCQLAATDSLWPCAEFCAALAAGAHGRFH